MITKERLEELLLNHEPIWCIGKNKNVFKIGNKKKNTKNFLNYYVEKYSGDNYFETEEDAKWELEMTATRTETLKLPTWEDFKNFVNQYIKFYHNEYTYILESCFYEDGKETIEINCSYYDYGDNLLKLPLTKENYIEACKLCLRLFKGEEV